MSARVGGALLAALVLLSAPAALALPKYRTEAVRFLGHDKDDPLWELTRKVMPCVTCHTQPQGGKGWNPFGQSLQAEFRAQPHANFRTVLRSVLAKNADADADGYPDALEFFARTLPGDPRSRPAEALAVLHAEFEKAGGLTQYQPRTGPPGK